MAKGPESADTVLIVDDEEPVRRTFREWLDRAGRIGDDREAWLRRDSLLANLRDQPRFQQILASMAYRRGQRPAASR